MRKLRLYNLEVPVGSGERALYRAALRRLGLQGNQVAAIIPVQRAVDARGGHPRWNITADVTLTAKSAEEFGGRWTDFRNIGEVPDHPSLDFTPGTQPFPGRPLIVGSGPAGMFAAWVLARHGYRPLVIERGAPAPERLKAIGRFNSGNAPLDPDANALFGEGGAGTFSDGKLYTRKNRDPYLPAVLKLFVELGAPEEILIDAAPHVGTDKLAPVVVNMRHAVLRMGGEMRFRCRMNDAEVGEKGFAAALVSQGAAPDARNAADGECPSPGEERIETRVCILAVGHSARDTFETLLARGVFMEPKPFQFGVRIEHPQEMVNRWQWRDPSLVEELGPAEYFLTCSANPELPAIHSFCMCPGGMIVPAVSEEGELCTNGMSFSLRNMKWANAGLVATLNPADYGGDLAQPLAGIEFQRRWEQSAFLAGGGDFMCPAQPASDFLARLTLRRSLDGSYPRGRRYVDMASALPATFAPALAYALGRFERAMPGFAGNDGILHAVESRASSPVRITRDATTRESVSVPGLYPVGEGAGYAGGIMSAALDGVHSAAAIIRAYAPPV